MSLASGTRLGPYEITGALGAGGMGEVYRARDTKLNRDVAIKVLPEAFALDTERLARFTREAQVLASLNHPNIAAIYGIEEQGSTRALVMELVEGEDLSQRIARGAIPLDEALPIARQIAEALDAAHEQGIVHRDLKPANIKVRPDGTVKVLDFGLAKALDPAAASAVEAMNSPTITAPAMTMHGVILGTAAYMSPEQAKGRPVDRRTDIFAFGCVLYEMLTGRRAFDGADVTEVLGAIVRLEPDWTRLPAHTPAAIRRLLRRCLQKDRTRRIAHAADVRMEIDEALSSPESTVELSAPARPARPVPWMAACGGLALAVAVLAAVHFSEPPPVAPAEMRLDISTPGTIRPSEFALSPDGGSVVFVAAPDGISRLWIRRLDRTEARPLAGTEGANNPFWSPEGSAIGFVAGNRLKRIAAAGGPVVALADASPRFGGSWNANGDILFVGPAGLQRLNVAGGPPTLVIALTEDVGPFWYPEFGPDGVHFLYQNGLRRADGRWLYLGSLDGSAPKRLGPADSQAAWLAPDRILYVLQGRLVAQRLDVERGELTGDPETLADPVGVEVFRGAFSVSANRRIAYRSGVFQSRWMWVDRAGEPVGAPLDFGAAEVTSVVVAPDGRRGALDATLQGNRDVWLADLVRGGATRLTFDPERDGIPVWSHDGKVIAFESARKGDFDIYVKPSDGSASETLLVESPQGQWPQDWSKDGQFLLYFSGRDQSPDQRQLLALPLTGRQRTPIDVAAGLQGKFSPDGRWVAYQTLESGQYQVVVQAFPVAAGKWQVSASGGSAPRWSADGKELYFISDGMLMAAAVRSAGSGFEAAAPVRLFDVRDPSNTGFARAPYDVASDGRFLVNRLTDAALTTPMTLLLNWNPASR